MTFRIWVKRHFAHLQMLSDETAIGPWEDDNAKPEEEGAACQQ
jgi:hypothetical protein